MKPLLLTTIAAVLLVGCVGRLIAPAPPPRGIWRAADQGNIEAVKKKLDAGVDIHMLDKKYGFAPLHYAAEGGYKEIVELLLAKGADVNQRDKIGRTPTYWAMRYGRKEVTAILRKHGGKTEIELAPKTSIWNAVAANNIEFVKELLISGEDVNAKFTKGARPLHATGMFGRKDVVPTPTSACVPVADDRLAIANRFGADRVHRIHFCRIKEVHPSCQRGINLGMGVGLIRLGAKGHGAKTELRHLHAGAAERVLFHDRDPVCCNVAGRPAAHHVSANTSAARPRCNRLPHQLADTAPILHGYCAGK